MPIFDPHICLSDRESQKERLEKPESDQERYALGYENKGFSCQPAITKAFSNQQLAKALQTDLTPENGNPGALAGATGANIKAASFETEYYRQRAEKAKDLCHAIADCHPDDAVMIIAAALDDLRPGQPITAFRSLMAEAEAWAAFATRNELKCYAVAAFNAMRPADQQSFLGYVQGRAAA